MKVFPHLSQPFGLRAKECFKATHLGLVAGSAILSSHDNKAKFFEISSRWEIGSLCIAANHCSLRDAMASPENGKRQDNSKRVEQEEFGTCAHSKKSSSSILLAPKERAVSEVGQRVCSFAVWLERGAVG